MESLISNSLEIVTPNLDKLTTEDINLFNKSLATLDSWCTPETMKNLDIDATKVSGTFRSDVFSSGKRIYFVFEESEVVDVKNRELLGSFITLPNIEVQFANEIEEYVKFCKRKQINGMEDFMTLQTALALLQDDKNSNCYINYILTKPKQTKEDFEAKVGSRIIDSLCKNPSFFSETETPIKSYSAMIGVNNNASIGAFRKFGFATCPNNTNKDYDMFYKAL